MNDLEVATAAYLDGQFTGRSGELAEFLLRNMLAMCESDPDLRQHLEAAIHAPETFKNIRDFLGRQSRS
ncbi:hypothetical protein [Mesorhizobium captivum]|uniref:hypothetical protein n=1 Tax=Mesorhizobium captivum TaxID=3072319 RepID=UPI002A247310|nr:hypothetical protein [Mesorhizobium sp. VK22E]MDX8509793.1 hypothetical protein [Mesorhizobium sp. VK22E]